MSLNLPQSKIDKININIKHGLYKHYHFLRKHLLSKMMDASVNIY